MTILTMKDTTPSINGYNFLTNVDLEILVYRYSQVQ